jgi:hypothetical protein
MAAPTRRARFDFEPLRDVLAARFSALTTLLDGRWRMLLDGGAALLASRGYRRLLPPQVGAPNVVMQRIVLSSPTSSWADSGHCPVASERVAPGLRRPSVRHSVFVRVVQLGF